MLKLLNTILGFIKDIYTNKRIPHTLSISMLVILILCVSRKQQFEANLLPKFNLQGLPTMVSEQISVQRYCHCIQVHDHPT